MESLYRRVGTQTGYWPHHFLRSMCDYGGLAVAKTLLAREQTSASFGKLLEAGQVDLSVETPVLDERYAHLFEPEEVEVARQRLAEVPASGFPGECV